MTWNERQSLGLCCRRGCTADSTDGDYCSPHYLDQLERQKVSMARLRAFRRAQLPLFTFLI